MKQRWLSFAACLCSLAVCFGATNASPSADTLLKQLAASPYDKALLATLARTAGAVSNAQDRARCLAVYCLGTLAVGDTDAANKGKSNLAKTSPSSPYLQTLSFENLSDPCPMCHGDGKVEGICSLCRGTGKCTACRGAGTVKRSTFSGSRTVETAANCTSCRGSGECNQCKGTKKESKPCSRCAGSGKVWSPDRIKTEYLTMLAGSGSGGASASSNSLDFGDITRKPAPASTGAPPSAGQVRTVEVTGTGVSADEALKDAFSSAVKTCIGVMVNAEQVVENENVIKDEILTYSNGYIKDYDDLGTEPHEGLVVRSIRATVILGKLAAKLREKNIAVNEIKGESLFAEAITKNQERTDFKSMLVKVLRDYEPRRLWTPQLIERRMISQTDQAATIEFLVSLVPDKAAIASFHEELQKVLATKYRGQRLNIIEKGKYWSGDRGPLWTVEAMVACGSVSTAEGETPVKDLFRKQSAIIFVDRVRYRELTAQEKERFVETRGVPRTCAELSCVFYPITADDWETYFEGSIALSARKTKRFGRAWDSTEWVDLTTAASQPVIVGSMRDSAGREVDNIEWYIDHAVLGLEGVRGFEFAPVGILHSEQYSPEQYICTDHTYARRKPLSVTRTFKINELRAIRSIELSIELREVNKDGQMAVRLPNEAPRQSPPVARVPSPEILAEGLVKDAMNVGTAALDSRVAIGSGDQNTNRGQSADSGPVATAEEGQEKTIGLLRNESKQVADSKGGEFLTWGEKIQCVLIFSGTIWLCVVIHRWLTRCPSCGKGRARVLRGSELLNQYQGSRTKKVCDQTRNRKGEIILTTEREVVIPTIESEYLDNYKCKFCGHEWQSGRNVSRDG